MSLFSTDPRRAAWFAVALVACSAPAATENASNGGAGGNQTSSGGASGASQGGTTSGGAPNVSTGGRASSGDGGAMTAGGADSSRGGEGQLPAAGNGGAPSEGNGGTTSRGGGASPSGGQSAGRGGAQSTGGAAGSAGANFAGSAGAAGDRCDIAKAVSGQTPTALGLTGNLGTHDPSVSFAHGQYYEFQTGAGLPTKTSTNLTEWKAGAPVFGTVPSWIQERVAGVSDLWAPDISYFGGAYHLYYSASTFGSNKSCIGHATRAALNSGSWTDQGPVICSNAGTKDDWNAIDPNAIVDAQGAAWLAFGSFWGGLKLIALDSAGKRANTELYAIAARPSNGGAIEAPYIVRRCGYYYLFASFDSCCKGADSTYKIMVGRATSVTGPYKDKAGVEMMKGGGTLVLEGGTRWRGPGHNAVIFVENKAYNVYHSYDANNNGASVLRVSELVWSEDGWPVSGGP